MRIDIFRQSFGMTLFWLVSVMALFVIRDNSAPVLLAADFQSQQPLYNFFASFESMLPDIVESLLIVLLLLWSGLLITRILIRNMMVQERTYMPIILYVLLSCGSYFGSFTLVSLLVSSLVLYSSYLMIFSFRREVSYGLVFNASFIAGVASLLYVKMLLMVLMILIAIILFRKNGRAVIVSLVGFVFPFAIISYIYWGVGYSIGYIAEQIMAQILSVLQQNSAFFTNLRNPVLLFQWAMMVVGVVLSIVTFFKQSSYIRTRPYKLYIYFIWLLIILLPVFIVEGRSVIDIGIVAIPQTVLLSVYFAKAKGVIPKVIYILFCASVILYNLLPVIFA